MWNHCPCVENPADVGSRGEAASKLKNNKLRWRGPSSLSEPLTNWPSSEQFQESITKECLSELKRGQAMEASDKTVLLVSTSRPDLEACIPIAKAAVTSCSELQPWCFAS